MIKLFRLSRIRIPVLPFYHLVSNRPPDHVFRLFRVRGTAEFIRDLDQMLLHYTVTDLAGLIDYVREGGSSGKPVLHLSFDDGLRECHEVIMPLLLRKGVPATFFVNPAFIGNHDLFYRFKAAILLKHALKNRAEWNQWVAQGKVPRKDPYSLLKLRFPGKDQLETLANRMDVDFGKYLRKKRPYLNPDELKDMAGKGFTIGSHGIDHRDYQEIGTEEQISQTREGMAGVSRIIPQKYRVFAFPFTDHRVSGNFFRILYSEEKTCPSLTFGTAGLKKDQEPFHLQRIPMERYAGSFASVMTGQYVRYLCKVPLNKNEIVRK